MRLTQKKMNKIAADLGVEYDDILKLLAQKYRWSELIDTIQTLTDAKELSLLMDEERLSQRNCVQNEDSERFNELWGKLALEEVLSTSEEISQEQADKLYRDCPSNCLAEDIASELADFVTSRKRIMELKRKATEVI